MSLPCCNPHADRLFGSIFRFGPAVMTLLLSLIAHGTLLAIEVADADSVAEFLKDGTDAVRLGEYDEAFENLDKVLTAEPTEEAARLAYAEALVATGKYEDAFARLQAHPEHQSSVRVMAAICELHLRIGQIPEALAAIEIAAKVGAKTAAVTYLRGECLRQQGKLDEARRSFEACIDVYRDLSEDEAAKTSPRDFVYWGLALRGLNRRKEADSLMFPQAEDRVKELAGDEDIKNAFLYVEWGKLFLATYNFPDSRSFYRDVIDQNPRHVDALVELADNYITDFQEGTKRFDLAEKFVKRALRVNPRCAGAYRVLGRIWFYDGYMDRAVKDFEKALEHNSSDLRTLGMLASSHYVRGDQAAFDATEKRALEINPKGAEFYHTIALAIEQKFRYPEIVRFADLALSVDPDYWPAYVSLGINCLRTGESARGRELLQRAWDNDKFNPWVKNTRMLLRHMDKHHVSFENERFQYSLPRAAAPIMRPYIEPLLDRAYESMQRRYKVKIKTPVRIESFSVHKWFSARTIGLEGLPASGACFGRVVTLTTPKAFPQNWGAVAWHEFAHVITLQMTDYRVPRWLTEGVSVYEEGLENPLWGRPFQREIADAWASGWILPLGELDFGFSKPKFPGQILLSYYQGCLVVSYITDKWGFDKVLAILDGYRDFGSTAEVIEKALGEDLETFDRGFNAFVSAWIATNGYAPSPAGEIIPGLELRKENEPDNIKLLVDLAWAYLINDHEVDALLTISKVLENHADSEPGMGDAHAVKAMVRLKDKKTREAREEFEKALGLGTRFRFRAHSMLGDLLVKEDPKAAIGHLEEAVKVSPVAGCAFPPGGPNVYYKLAKLYEDAGDNDKAIAQMEALAPLAPENGDCRLRIVKYAVEKRDHERAARYLEDLMFIQPFEIDFHRMLAASAEALGQHDVVIREVRILMTDPGTNPLSTHRALARAYLGKKEFQKALDEANRVLEIDDEDEAAAEIAKEAKAGLE
jgi:tetratricopeptide (TPR) repeat protein